VCEKGEKRQGRWKLGKERIIYEAGAGYISQPGAFVDSNNWDHLSGANYLENVEWNGMGANMMMMMMDLSLRCADTLLHTYISMSGCFFLLISFSFLSGLQVQVRSRNMEWKGSLNLGFFLLWLRAVVCGGKRKGQWQRRHGKARDIGSASFYFQMAPAMRLPDEG